MSIQQKLFTIEEFEAFIALPENRDRYFELIDGEFVEKAMPTEEHGIVVLNLGTDMRIFLRVNPIGRVMTEVRVRVPDDPHNSRQPDLAFFLNTGRPVVKRGAVPQMPDLVIEVKSPDDSYKGMRARAAYYLANGALMVWLAYPEKRLIEIFRKDADVEILTENDILTGGDLLPGFEVAVRDIFAL